jgi:hypothetical protein
MVLFLKRRANKRKLRLFAVACCHRIWPLVSHGRSRAAVLVAERFADGQATSEELRAAEAEANAIWLKDALDDAAMACFHVCTAQVAGLHAAGTAIRAVWSHQLGEARRRGDLVPDGLSFSRPIQAAEEAEQCRLLCDIFGNPFQPLPPKKGKRAWEDQKCRWLAWNDGTVQKIAQVIYDERAFDRMPILADALEDAGCADQSILDHCRQAGEHVRGCWVVDLLLDKR